MSSVDKSFWPKDIGPQVLPPLAVLAPRARELAAITNGLLIGEVTSDKEDDWMVHRFDAVVPALDDFRQRLLSVRHARALVYPAFVESPPFEGAVGHALARMRIPGGPQGKDEASTGDELESLIRTALHSHQVRSLLASLIAQANLVILGSPDVAVAAVKHSRDGARIEFFRLHLPVGGHFGSPVTDARRASVINMIQKEGKRVVTIHKRDGTFVPVGDVGVTRKGFLRIDGNNVEQDDLGELPEIDRVMARL